MTIMLNSPSVLRLAVPLHAIDINVGENLQGLIGKTWTWGAAWRAVHAGHSDLSWNGSKRVAGRVRWISLRCFWLGGGESGVAANTLVWQEVIIYSCICHLVLSSVVPQLQQLIQKISGNLEVRNLACLLRYIIAACTALVRNLLYKVRTFHEKDPLTAESWSLATHREGCDT